MKIVIAILFCLFAAAAFGQTAGVISSQPTPTIIPDHPLHASPHAMATEQPIVGGTSDTYSYERGEQPLWQFGPMKQEVPLGDVARAYRQTKLVAKRSTVTLEK